MDTDIIKHDISPGVGAITAVWHPKIYNAAYEITAATPKVRPGMISKRIDLTNT